MNPFLFIRFSQRYISLGHHPFPNSEGKKSPEPETRFRFGRLGLEVLSLTMIGIITAHSFQYKNKAPMEAPGGGMNLERITNNLVFSMNCCCKCRNNNFCFLSGEISIRYENTY